MIPLCNIHFRRTRPTRSALMCKRFLVSLMASQGIVSSTSLPLQPLMRINVDDCHSRTRFPLMERKFLSLIDPSVSSFLSLTCPARVEEQKTRHIHKHNLSLSSTFLRPNFSSAIYPQFALFLPSIHKLRSFNHSNNHKNSSDRMGWGWLADVYVCPTVCFSLEP